MNNYFTLLNVIFLLNTVFNCCECKICESVDIRNSKLNLNALRNCSIVLGSVQIAFMHNVAAHEWQNISFPELKEITDFLFVYRVHGLTSLGRLFPNLSVIRGHKLVMDYALIVYDNEDLNEIALSSLTKIERGFVRIENNQFLCHLRSVDWNRITTSQMVVIDSDSYLCNKNIILCSDCPKNICWNDFMCQRLIETMNCHEQCLGGCARPKDPTACDSCRYFNDHGRCLTKCPSGKYIYDEYFCVTEQECYFRNRIPYLDVCMESCLPKYKEIIEKEKLCQNCTQLCDTCEGYNNITDLQSIQKIKGCRILNGILEIRRIHNTHALKELKAALTSLEVITGSLLIIRNDLITSLDFLKNLKIIRGKHLINNYSVYVYGNPNLKTLFNWTTHSNLTIRKGRLYFHYNPKLCLTEIEKLREHSNLHYNFSPLEISFTSNGDHIECNYDPIITNVKKVNSSWALIEWHSYTSPATHVTVGYQIFYSSENPPLKHYIPEECHNSMWEEETYFLESDQKQQILNLTLSNLKPFTTYSYYISSILNENSVSELTSIRDVGAFSKIKMFQTLPDQPSRPHSVQAFNVSSNQIRLKWRPPVYPNGQLSKYVITIYLQQFEKTSIDERDYCLAPKIPDYEQLQGFYTGSNEYCQNDENRNEETMFVSLNSENEINNDCDNFKYIANSQKRKLPNHFSGLDLRKRDITTVNDVQEKIRTLPTGEYSVWFTIVDADVQNLTINNLLHYSVYQIYISACNDGIEFDFCSTVTMVSQRTSPKPNADDIDEVIVLTSKSLYWSEPNNSNSNILYYTVEFFKLFENVNIEPLCITRKEHQQNGYILKLDDLPDGSYQIRIRATSLYGDGNWTKPLVVEIKSFNIVHLMILVFILICYISWKIYEKIKIYTHVEIVFPAIEIIRPNIFIENKLFDIINVKHLNGNIYRGKFSDINCLLKISKIERINVLSKYKFFDGVEHFMPGRSFLLRILGVATNKLPYIIVYEYAEEGILGKYLENCHRNEITIPDKYIYEWAAEIADGMTYLASKKFIHGDLTSKNILLTKNFTIKISKLGLGYCYAPSDYINYGNKIIPLRWTCKENLKQKNHPLTLSSDVWSYGVVLWEIANCCRLKQPYHDLQDSDVIEYVCNDGLLQPPPGMPPILNRIIRQCLNDVDERPTFQDIALLDFATFVHFRSNSFVFSSASTSENSVIQSNPLATQVNIHFKGDKPKSNQSYEEVSLIDNEVEPSTSLMSFKNLKGNCYNKTLLHKLFQIKLDDWISWKKSRRSNAILISFRNSGR